MFFARIKELKKSDVYIYICQFFYIILISSDDLLKVFLEKGEFYKITVF